MLTDLKIQHLKAEKGKTKRHTDRDGLVLEIRSSGKKVFIFRFQWNKKPQTITLGCYPSLSLADARTQVLAHRVLIDSGVDPRKSDVDIAQTKLTFQEVAEQWHLKNKHCWKEVTSNRHYKSLVRDILPFIGNKPIDNITKIDLLQLIQPHEIKGHHEISHRLYARLEAIFEYAVGASLTESYPFIGLKKALAPKPSVTNQPAINPNDAHEMLSKIKESDTSRITKLYIELLAHLFVRPSELRLATWSEFSLIEAEWNIPKERMKMKAPHWVPLSPHVLSLLLTSALFNMENSYSPCLVRVLKN